MLDGRDRELRTMLLNNFLEVSESLDFFEQKPITARKRKKLNCERVSVTAEANAISKAGLLRAIVRKSVPVGRVV